MSSKEKFDVLPAIQNEHLDSAKKEAAAADEAARPERLSQDPFGSISLVASLFGITFAYLPVFAAPLLVSLGLQVLEQAYGQSKDIAFIPCSNAIGQCVAFLVVGRLSDSLGCRWFVIVGNALSMIGYMVAARAHNLATNIGGLLAVMFALQLIPFSRRYLGYAYMISAWGPIISIAAGTAFTLIVDSDQSWRWINYVAFIASFVSLAMELVFYHPQESAPEKGHSKSTVAKKIDYIGTFIWVGSTVAFLLGIYLGGQRYPWKSARTIVPLVVGGVGWFVALGWEFLTRSKFASPVLPLLANRNYLTLTLTIAFVSMCWTAPTMLWSQQIATILGADTLLAGWYYGAALASPELGQLIAGVMATGFPMLQPQLIVACILLLAFGPALAGYTVTQVSMALVLVIASGTGVGIAEVICVVGATSSVPVQEFGVAAGFLWTVRRIATSIATAVYTTILNSKVEKNLQQLVVPVLAKGGLTPQAIAAFLQALLAGDSTALSQVPGVTPQLIQSASIAARTAFADSFKIIYLTSIAFGACAIVVALFVRNNSLDRTRTPLVVQKLREFASDRPGLTWIL